MLNKTLEQLSELKLPGMREALVQQLDNPHNFDISFEERIALMVQNEISNRESNRSKNLIKQANLRVQAHPSDIDYGSQRKLNKELLASILTCSWVKQHKNLIIDGATGTGKTWLSCCIGWQICNNHIPVYYTNINQLIDSIKVARIDGSFSKLYKKLIKPEVLIFDDWGLKKLDKEVSYDIFNIIDERYYDKSNIFVGQIPATNWHQLFYNATLAEAVIDRVITKSIFFNLRGDSMRKKC